MAWYDTGTVSVTNGSTAVIGSGTNFISGAQIGEAFYGPDGRLYEIQAIVSATSLTLADPYLGSTQSGQAYKIVPTQSLVATLAAGVSELITDFQTVKDEAGAGKFQDGTAALPGIKFNLDQDTGFSRPAANQIGFSTAGVQRALLTSTGLNNVAIGATTPSTFAGTTGSFSGNLTVGSATITGVVTTTSFTNTDTNLEIKSAARVRGVNGGDFQTESGGTNDAAAPTYTFRGDSDTGIFWGGSNTVGFTTNGSERMRIKSDGEVQIAGTTDRGAFNLQVNGTGVWGAGAYTNGSDIRLKHSISDMPASLEVVKKLRPVTFTYKQDYSKDQAIQTGFIAQELQEALAGQDYLGGVVIQGMEHLSVAYQALIPVLTKAIQEQQSIIAMLEARITALEAK
jgi:hypothetical protein